MKLEVYYCEECGKPFTENDEEDAESAGFPTDRTHQLCPNCYLEKLKRERGES